MTEDDLMRLQAGIDAYRRTMFNTWDGSAPHELSYEEVEQLRSENADLRAQVEGFKEIVRLLMEEFPEVRATVAHAVFGE